MTAIVSKKNDKNNSKNFVKKNYTSYSKLSEVKLITIGLASPERIKQWSEKMLPNGKILGEVMNANTLHHKTFKPQKGGLFCERIFGPLKDFECACGKPMKLTTKKDEKLINSKQDDNNSLNISSNEKNNNFETHTRYQKSKKIINLNKSILGASELNTKSLEEQISLPNSKSISRLKNFCNICEVEYTWSVMRRYQLGYIKLISPVTHVWYLKGNPSYLSILLDMKKRHLEYITYCSETLTIENVLKGGTLISKSSDIVSSWKKLKLKIKSEQENFSNKKNVFEIKSFKENSKLNTNFKSKFMSYSKISKLLNKTNKSFIEKSYEPEWSVSALKRNGVPPMQVPNYFSSILEKEVNELKKIDYFPNNNFLIKFLSISNFKNKNDNNLSKLAYTVANIEKLKKRNNLKFKKFDFCKNFINTKKKNNLSDFMDTKKSFDKEFYSKILHICKIINQLKSFNSPIGFAYMINIEARPPLPLPEGMGVNELHAGTSSRPTLAQGRDGSMEGKGSKFQKDQESFKSLFCGTYMVGNDNVGTLINNINNDFSNDLKYLKKYSQKLFSSFKNLKYLSTLIEKSKCSLKKLNENNKNNVGPLLNNLEKFNYKNFKSENIYLQSNSKSLKIVPIKKILKKISVPAYILINLDVYSKKIINKNCIDLTWEKVSHEAYIKALIRGNQILNRVNLSYYDKSLYSICMVDNDHAVATYEKELLNLSSSSINLEFLFKKLKKRIYNFSHKKIFNSKVIKNKIELFTLSHFSDSFVNLLISNFLFNQFYSPSLLPPLVSPPSPEGKGPACNPPPGGGHERPAGSKGWFSELPESPAPTIQVPEQLYDLKSRKRIKKIVNFLIKDLSSIFIKIVLKNKNFKLKFWLKFLSNFDSKESSHFSKNVSFFINKYLSSGSLKINQFKEIKKNLISNLLVSNLGFIYKKLITNPSTISNYSLIKADSIVNYSVDISSITHSDYGADINFFKHYLNVNKLKQFKNKLKLNLTSVQPLPKDGPAHALKGRAPTLSLKGGLEKIHRSRPSLRVGSMEAQGDYSPTRKELPVKSFKSTIKTKKLFNNIYCLSHRERWEVENDWNFLYYYVTVQNSNTTPMVEQNNAYHNENNRLYLTPLNTSSLTSSTPSFEEKLIHNYKNRFENIYKTDFFNSLTNSKMDSDISNSFAKMQSIHSSLDNITTNNLSLNSNTLFSGPGIVQLLLSEFNFFEIKKIDKQNRILLYQLNKQILKLKKRIYNRTSKKELKEAYKKRDLLIRRTKLVRKLFIKESSPQNMILTVLPVLPPDLRPIVKMGGQIAASDLNRLYQRVIYRNDRLKKFLKDPATSNSYEMKYAQRLLQEAVDNLIQNGKSGVIIEKDSRGRALKSLSDILKGKQGRFRQYLLGKRVDYSGRSVIVVGPRLKLHECGIPKEMALELYLPFLLKRILNDKLSRTVVGAKLLIKTNPSLVWELLREIMQTSPVLLNRAPTLHRLGIQAFQPKLIDGRAILLHPLVCAAFNADFDGDQMAVHVPITVEARAEAWKLMLSRNSILSTATGDPLAIPSQDMVLGCYYLTTNLLNANNKKLGSSLNQISIERNFLNEPSLINKIEGSKFDKKIAYGFYFSTIEKVLKALELKKVNLHSNIWLKCSLANVIDNGSDQEEPIEIRLEPSGNWREIYNKTQKRYNFKNICLSQFVFTTPGKIIFNLAIQKALN